MKLFLFSLFFVFSLTFAQETASPDVQSRCFNGTTEVNGTRFENEVECDFAMHSCMTKYEAQEGYFKVVRECTQTLACENNWAGNDPKCYPGENDVRICFFCCRGDLCNSDDTTIPEEEVPSGDGEEA